MRESNFAFPSQNRATVCISAQLYDRRALDTTSALPLFNSLTHLVHLTSASPRIREIVTMDGGLERLVRILHEFCICPPPPEIPSMIYGLSPSNARPNKVIPTLNPTSFDKHAAYRFSLVFQCVVNIGVRGNEPIRRRVVEAGTLDVVGCILEAWLASKGFAVGPSSSATGLPRETREQRLTRREEHRQAVELARALQRQIAVAETETPATDGDDEANISATSITRDATVRPGPPSHSNSSASTSTASTSTSVSNSDASNAPTPVGTGTPTGAVLVSSRDRSGTIIGRTTWDNARASSPASADTSRPETETEDDGDADMEAHLLPQQRPRRAVVGIVSDDPGAPSPLDSRIIINGEDRGVEDGIVSLEPNDDFAMGAPPGAPGAIGTRAPEEEGVAATPRAAPVALPAAIPIPPRVPPVPRAPGAVRPTTTVRPPARTQQLPPGTPSLAPFAESGPYRDEDVLLSLQLLAYLSKYPHVRQAFYKPRVTFHPASISVVNTNLRGTTIPPPVVTAPAESSSSRNSHNFFRAFAPRNANPSINTRGKEKAAPIIVAPLNAPARQTRHTNVFSLVERFTFRPSSTESGLPNPPPKLPPEIQYWAGVIMRNACRKDDSQGGIRQCANMLCGKWEKYAREFAKCRRCRKAKYCGKECQSTAWSEGHRFWCSVKEQEVVEVEDDAEPHRHHPWDGHDEPEGTVRGTATRDRDRDRERRMRERERALAMGVAAALEAGVPRDEDPRVVVSRLLRDVAVAVPPQPRRPPAPGPEGAPQTRMHFRENAGGGRHAQAPTEGPVAGPSRMFSPARVTHQTFELHTPPPPPQPAPASGAGEGAFTLPHSYRPRPRVVPVPDGGRRRAETMPMRGSQSMAAEETDEEEEADSREEPLPTFDFAWRRTMGERSGQGR